MNSLSEVMEIYAGSNGERTKELYARLMALGPMGVIAANLLRATKASERAKVYRGRGYKGAAYDKKQWSMDNAVAALLDHARWSVPCRDEGNQVGACARCDADQGVGCRRPAGELIVWGWGVDQKQEYHRHVLYVDLPTGQISFHTGRRGQGPDYPAPWDGKRGMAAERITGWCAQLLDEVPA